jgi:hypothetical protein
MKNLALLTLFLTSNTFATCYLLKTDSIRGEGYPGFSRICVENGEFVLFGDDGRIYFRETLIEKYQRVQSTCGKEHYPCTRRVLSHYETIHSFSFWASLFPNSSAPYRGTVTVQGQTYSYRGFVK